MTAGTVDFPEVDYDDPAGSVALRSAKALERIATAMEQLVLNQMAPSPSETNAGRSDIHPWDLPPTPVVEPAALPYQAPTAVTVISAAPQWVCPVHHTVKVVPAGVSARTGKAYDSFLSCTERDCQQKPPRR